MEVLILLMLLGMGVLIGFSMADEDYADELLLSEQAAYVLELCEADLPRNQHCELTARIIEDE